MSSPIRPREIDRRWLWCYPRGFRREHGEEILGVLIEEAGGDRRALAAECLALLGGGVSMRLRPRLARSDRWGRAVVRLMYLAAVAQLAVVAAIVATTGAVRASIVAADPGYTPARWHSELVGSIDPLVALGGLTAILCVWMAWCSGRGRRWPRVLFAVCFGVTTYSLLHGLGGGSASYARADLVVGIAVWLAELATVIVIAVEGGRILTRRSGDRRMGSPAATLALPVVGGEDHSEP